MPKGKRIWCEVCRKRERLESFACCADCIKWLIREFRRNRPKRKRIKKDTLLVAVEVNMNACDACGLSRNAKNYSRHNCFQIIKQVGRSELADQLLTETHNMPDTAALSTIKEALLLERANTPYIETQDVAVTA